MSIEHYWAACRLDIPATPKSLLRLISLSYNAEHDRACYFSLETLAAYTSLNKSTVIRATDWLEEMGLLVVARGGGRHAVNLYVPIPHPNDRVSATKERVAPRDRFSASAVKKTVAPCRETVALSQKTVAPCSETVAPRNPKGFKEKKEKEKPNEESMTQQKPEFYELPEYRGQFSGNDAAFVVMYHRHGKEKFEKYSGIELTERIATLIAMAEEKKRVGVDEDSDALATIATEAASAPVASQEAKAETDRIAKAKAECPLFTYDSNVIPLTVGRRRPKEDRSNAGMVEFRELLIVGGITPNTVEERIAKLHTALGGTNAIQFMREFVASKGAKIREERNAVRTSGAIAAAVRWFKPAQLAA